MTALTLTKHHGLGNDFVVLDARSAPLPLSPAQIRAIGDRHRGVGFDQMVTLERDPDGADLFIRFHNSDGSEAGACGNGTRCAAALVLDETGRDALTIRTTGGRLAAERLAGGRFRVDMGPPILRAAEIPTTLPGDPPIDAPLEIEGTSCRVTCVSMGNPHAVLYVGDVARWPVAELGPKFEHHPAFPRRVNAHFVEVLGSGEVRMRTWERGSGITQACGTGACAVCVAGVLTGRTGRKLLAHLPGGDLDLEWSEADNHVYMTGPATEVFSGDWPD